MIKINDLPRGTVERIVSDIVLETLRGKELDDRWFRIQYFEQGIGLAPFDIAIARLLAEHYPLVPLVEVGAGMGQLSALVAVNGHPSWAIERDSVRLDMAHAVRAAIVRRFPQVQGHYSVVGDSFPNRTGYLVKNAVVCSSFIPYAIPDEQFDAILDALAPARGLIVAVRSFLVPERLSSLKNSWDYEPVLMDMLRTRGWGEPETVYEWRHPEYRFQPDKIVWLRRSQ